MIQKRLQSFILIFCNYKMLFQFRISKHKVELVSETLREEIKHFEMILWEEGQHTFQEYHQLYMAASYNYCHDL